MITKAEKGKVYGYNGILVLCYKDTDPNNWNETPMFYGVCVRGGHGVLRGERSYFSKTYYSETGLTIEDFSELTNAETGTWKKWFPNEFHNEEFIASIGMQRKTVNYWEEEDYDPCMWDGKSADGIG